jgi:serine/threonine protein kinase/Tol biopolymer transport system component
MPTAPPVDRISHYRVLVRLGKGAMGEVYRAVDERLGRAVAVKLLQRARAESADLQARLLREAQAASALNHPGIVTVHDVGSFEGQVFMVMELVEGERLSDLAQHGIPIAEALRLIADAADALGAAHARDILHRDVKSDNLMRTVEGRVKVLDFGLAKLRPGKSTGIETSSQPASQPASQPGLRSVPKVAPGAALAATLTTPEAALNETAQVTASTLDDAADTAPAGGLTPHTLTSAGQLVGTPAYMAPEQTVGGSADAQSEVWSLGVVLYELLTGRRPFDRDTVAHTLEAVRTGALFPPSMFAPDRKIPPAVDAVVMRALERDRNQRYRDMASFAADLQRLRADLLPPHPHARRRLLVGGIAALAALSLIATAIALVRPGTLHTPATVKSTRHLTFDPGCEEYPSFTPDGRTVVYDGLVDGDYEVLALDLATGEKRRLTHAFGWDYAAALSPDGRTVAYLRQTDAGHELHVMPFSGDAQPPMSLGIITTIPSWMGPETLVVSPDGDTLWRYDLPPSGPHKVQIAELPPSALVRYVTAFSSGDLVAMWMPSRQSLEFVLGEVPSGGTLREIEHQLPLDQLGLQAAPSQDGYYYARHGGSANELLRRPRSGGPPVVVPGGITASSGFSFSRDGRRLVYSTCRESHFVARLRTGQAPVELVPRGSWRDDSAVSIDAHRFVYASDRTGSHQVWLVDLDKHETRPLTGPDTANPALSRDKQWLAYADRGQGGIHLVSLTDANAAPRQLTSDPSDSRPQFSHDDRMLVFQRTRGDGGSRVWVVPISGGEPRPIGPPGSQWPAVSPTKNQVIFLSPTERGSLVMSTDLRGAEPRLVFKYVAPGDYESPHISPDGKRLLLVRKMTDVIELPLDERNPEPSLLWRAGTEGVAEADYAPDGDGLLASVAMWDGDLWLAEGEFN